MYKVRKMINFIATHTHTHITSLGQLYQELVLSKVGLYAAAAAEYFPFQREMKKNEN